jgi:hypothetical protein
VTNASFTTQAEFTAFSTAYNSAFRNINGTTANVSFDGTAFNFTGTGGCAAVRHLASTSRSISNKPVSPCQF